MFTLSFIGHLGADVQEDTERRENSFSVGVDVGFTREGQRITRWIYCHYHIANPLPQIGKGSKVYVEGSPRFNARKNGEDIDVFIHVQVHKIVVL